MMPRSASPAAPDRRLRLVTTPTWRARLILVPGPANGTVTWTPTAGSLTAVRPTRRHSPTRPATSDSNTATVTITINPVNDAPRPTPTIRRVTTNEDTATGGQLTAVDPEGESFTFSSPPEFAPEHGSVTVNADGTWSYTPSANYYGPDIFGYRVTDTNGAAGVGAVEITVSPVNDAPSAVNDAYSVTRMDTPSSPPDQPAAYSATRATYGQGLLWDFNSHSNLHAHELR